MERIHFDHKGFEEYFETTFQFIYRPDDDSKYLVDVVEQMQSLIVDQLKPAVCVEIGSGSGYVINSISKSFGSQITEYYATDINPIAIETTLASGRANGVTNVHVVETNLADYLKKNVLHRVDLLVTNPPFEPSPLEDVGRPGAICAWSAGPNGRAIIDRILVELPELMSESGVALMCCVKENDVEDIRRQMKKKNFHSTIVIERDGTTSSNYNRKQFWPLALVSRAVHLYYLCATFQLTNFTKPGNVWNSCSEKQILIFIFENINQQ